MPGIGANSTTSQATTRLSRKTRFEEAEGTVPVPTTGLRCTRGWHEGGIKEVHVEGDVDRITQALHGSIHPRVVLPHLVGVDQGDPGSDSETSTSSRLIPRIPTPTRSATCRTLRMAEAWEAGVPS